MISVINTTGSQARLRAPDCCRRFPQSLRWIMNHEPFFVKHTTLCGFEDSSIGPLYRHKLVSCPTDSLSSRGCVSMPLSKTAPMPQAQCMLRPVRTCSRLIVTIRFTNGPSQPHGVKDCRTAVLKHVNLISRRLDLFHRFGRTS